MGRANKMKYLFLTIGWCAIICQLMFAFVIKNVSLNFVCMCTAITSFILSCIFAFIDWKKTDKEVKSLMTSIEEEMMELSNNSDCNG